MNQDFNILYLRNADYSCEIISNYGACINSYKFKDREFISGYQSIEEVSLQQYKGVLLAPFPNRIAKAKFSFDDQHHALTINRAKEGLALHGFLYDKEFRLIEKDADKLILAYDYDGDAAGYPFPFSIAVSYYLEEQGLLRIKTHISNEGKQRLPFGLGWHPYFQMESIIDDLSLSFPSSSYLELDEKLIPTGELKAFAEKQKILRLDNQNYDTCFLLDSQDSASFILSDKTMDLHISTPSIEHFPYFQIYTAKDRKSI
ncbi:MAG: aldose 1-epimerase, partial [Chitinophagales bacterium]